MKPDRRALVRKLPRTYPQATAEQPVVIDLQRAEKQHQAYVTALGTLVDEVMWADTLEEAPDSVFVEDQVVVGGGVALLTRSGLPSRRLENPTIATALAPYLQLEYMEGPATLDGGDVLRVGKHFFVGQSGRTNREGFEALRRVFSPLGFSVTAVPVRGDLHLKCVCSAVRPDLVVAVGAKVPLQIFEQIAEVIDVSERESYAANLLSNGTQVVMADGYPMTLDALQSKGIRVRTLALSEIKKGDGALTCMSVWF